MFKEEIIWTILPHGIRTIKSLEAPKKDKKVLVFSVFVSPRLSDTESPRSMLKNYQIFRNWPLHVRELKFELEFKSHVIKKELIASLDAGPMDKGNLWKQFFREDTFVRSYEFPKLHNYEIKSYPVGDIMNHISGLYSSLAKNSPDSLPQIQAEPDSEGNPVSPEKTLQPMLTELGKVIEAWEEVKKEQGQSLTQIQKDYIKVRNFFDREESNPPRMPHPSFKMVPPSPNKPEIDFHQMISILGDYPELMRRLGLLLDFTADISDSMDAFWNAEKVRLGFRVKPMERRLMKESNKCPWTMLAGGFIPKEKSGSGLKGGMLDLSSASEDFNPSGKFQLIQVDPDGAALKLLNAAANIQREVPRQFLLKLDNCDIVNECDHQIRLDILIKVLKNKLQITDKAVVTRLPGSWWLIQDEGNTFELHLLSNQVIHLFKKNSTSFDTPAEAGLASLQSAGIGLLRNERAVRLQKLLKNAKSRNDELSKQRIDIDLYAEDLLRGYTVEAQSREENSDAWGKWHSLCKRTGRYSFEGQEIEGMKALEDYGYVKGASASSSENATKLYLHESMFQWHGWSLVAPRPGRTIVPETQALQEKILFQISNNQIVDKNAFLDFLKNYHHLTYSIGDIQTFTNPFKIVVSNTTAGITTITLNEAEQTALVDYSAGSVSYFLKTEQQVKVVYDKLGTQEEQIVMPDNEPATGLKLKVTFKPVPGSLPRLRFGKTYRLRVKAVDLGGNDMSAKPDDESCASLPVRYTRFEPVVPPFLKPTKPYREGESVERMVIRSNYNQLSQEYYPAYDVRHVIPPKTSQVMAELHGKFDQYMQAGNFQSAFNIAVREEGKLDADAYPDEQLTIPFLPDPFAKGVVFQFIPPGAPSLQNDALNYKAFSFDATETEWYLAKPIRIRLEEKPPYTTDTCESLTFDNLAGNCNWDAVNRVLTIQVPKGEVVALRYSCCFDAGDLAQMGIWKWLTKKYSANELKNLEKMAIQGKHWMMTPYRELTLVHAVKQPLCTPTIVNLPGTRDIQSFAFKDNLGQTYASIRGIDPKLSVIHFSARSSGKLIMKGRWTEKDDRSGEKCSDVERNALAFEFNVTEDMKNWLTIPLETDPCTHFRHEFGDTKYRRVKYHLDAVSRFTDYFTPLNPQTGEPEIFSRSGPEVEVDVFNSARPDSPKVKYILPAFQWEQEVNTMEFQLGNPKKEIKQLMRTRKGGILRVYLERPWYSSGEGELLGVVLPQGLVGDEMKPYITQWGQDPIRSTVLPDETLTTAHFTGFSKSANGLSLEEVQTTKVNVVGYVPEYDETKKLWYCDISLDTYWIKSYFPFIRLALCRYQPNSIEGAHISRIVQTDFVQLANERKLKVEINEDYTAFYLEVSGYGSKYMISNKTVGNIMEVSLETMRRPYNEIDWEVVQDPAFKNQPFELDYEEQNHSFRWFTRNPVKFPAGFFNSGKYRFVVKEFERFSSDKSPVIPSEKRLVYSDIIEL